MPTTYQIHRYPAELIDVLQLGGRRVVVRPVLPQDEELTLAFFRDLSGSARYDRFMTSMREPPAELVRRFTQVDYADHLALVAEVFDAGRETVVAEARYVRLAPGLGMGEPATAEFAVSVAEPWQGRGLARRMLGTLVCRAAAGGVTRLVGETLATNTRMLALARSSGFLIRPSGDVRGLMLLEKRLAAPSTGQLCDGETANALAA